MNATGTTMQRLRSILLVLATACANGACAHLPGETLAVAIGPAPPPAPSGLLRVRTPTALTEDQDTLYYPHRDFRILSTGGEVLKRVRNADDPWDETPALVRLPAGSYWIESPTRHGGSATIPVVIEPGRTTEVYLDGSFRARGLPPGAYATLPDGEIVGWAAQVPHRP